MKKGIYAAKYRRGKPVEQRRAMRVRMYYRAIRRAKGMTIPEWLQSPWS